MAAAASLAEVETTPARARVESSSAQLGKDAPTAEAESWELPEARVQFVMALMADLVFEEGRTYLDMAECWGLHEVTCKRITAEASRRIKASVDPVQVRARLSAAWDSRLREVEAIPLSRYRDRIWATDVVSKAWAPLVGAAAPSRHELSGPGGGPIQVEATPAPEALLDALTTLVRALVDGGMAREEIVVRVLGEGEEK